MHTDLQGPVAVVSGAGKLYWALFIDDFSQYHCIYFLCKESDVLLAYKEFKAEAELLTGKWIKKLRDDKGGEYMSGEFDRFLKEHGTQRQHTEPRLQSRMGLLSVPTGRRYQGHALTVWSSPLVLG